MSTLSTEKTFSPFLPVLLLSFCLLALLSWNLYLVANQHTEAQRGKEQLLVQLDQAVRTEQRLKLLMTDLIELSKQDKEAEEIVSRYKIAFTPQAKTETPAAAK